VSGRGPDDAPRAGAGLTRRDLLKAAGVLPVAGALGVALGACDAPRRGTPAAAGGTGDPAPRFFTPHERATVEMLADYVIPRDDRSGSATDAGVPDFMDVFLAHPDTDPAAGAALRGGLAWLDAECRRRSGATFVASTDPQRRAVLDDIAWPARARAEMSHGVAFFNRFRDLTASGFFSSRVGYEDLQYRGNRAVRWTGCPDAALAHLGVDRSVLETRVPVQRRS
jgi:hypothetical protein